MFFSRTRVEISSFCFLGRGAFKRGVAATTHQSVGRCRRKKNSIPRENKNRNNTPTRTECSHTHLRTIFSWRLDRRERRPRTRDCRRPRGTLSFIDRRRYDYTSSVYTNTRYRIAATVMVVFHQQLRTRGYFAAASTTTTTKTTKTYYDDDDDTKKKINTKTKTTSAAAVYCCTRFLWQIIIIT